MNETTTLQTLIARYGVTMMAERVYSNPNMPDMPNGSTHWRVVFRIAGIALRKPSRQLTTYYSMGPVHTREPQTAEVLDCLLSDASGADESFEDWASDYGFDPDSRKAEKIYKAIQKSTAKLRVFLGEAFEMFIQAEKR